MELEVANEILVLASDGGFLEGDIPTDETTIQKDAQYFLDEAETALQQGWGQDEPTIVSIAKVGGIHFEPEADEEPPPMAMGDPSPGDPEPPRYATGVPPKSSGGFPARDLDSDNEPDMTITSEPGAAEVVTVIDADEFEADEPTTYKNLPIPPDIAEAVVTLPGDLTEKTDVEVRRLHSQFNALLARATWVLSQATNDLQAAEHLFDSAYRAALKKVDKIDPYTEKAKIAKVLEAETMEDITVLARDVEVQRHKANVVSLKALRDVYSGNVSVTSREWTMRQDEYEKGR